MSVAMESTALGDVSDFVRGITFRPDDIVENFSDDAIVCMRTKNIQSDLDVKDLISLPSSFVKRDEQFLQEGDILVSSANSWELVGKSCWVPKLGYLATAGGFICALRGNERVIDRRFLYHWMQHPHTKQKLRHCGRKTTNISNLSFERAERLDIPLPYPDDLKRSLTEQKRIAAILDKADGIRRKRQQALALTDQFLQSLFLDMFGDPVTNPKGWDQEPFEKLCELRLGKMLDARAQTGKNKRLYLGNRNVQWNRFDLTELKQMDFDSKDRETFKLLNGDVLICEGGEVGRSSVWRNDLEECYFQKALHRARPIENKARSEYVSMLMWFLAKHGALTDHTSTATIAHLTGVKLKKLLVPSPPFELQEEFERTTLKARELGSAAASLANHADDLFSSLVQRAFKGEL